MCGLLLLPEAGWLVSCGGADHCIHVWDYGTGGKLHTWTHADTFRCMAYLRTTGTVVAGTDEHNLISLPMREVSDAVRMRRETAEEAVREAERAARKAAQVAAAAKQAKAGSDGVVLVRAVSDAAR